MGSPAKARAKAEKKAQKAALKAAKKQAKQAAAIGQPAASAKKSEPDISLEQVRINRWRLWAAIAGVVIALIGLGLRIYSFLVDSARQ